MRICSIMKVVKTLPLFEVVGGQQFILYFQT
jgi:hypothetical protein